MASNPDVQAAIADTRASLSKSAANFDANAILRGAQLTVVGALRALQNPGIFKYEHYRQAVLAVCAGIVVRLIIWAPIILVKASLWCLSFFVNFEAATWDDTLVNGMDFVANQVLQLPFFLMSLMRYLTPTLDHVFMDSLQWVDYTYMQKHKSDDPSKLRAMYYANLRLCATHGATSPKKTPLDAISVFLFKFSRRAGISLAVYLLSYLPLVGRFVLPAASFYTFQRTVGTVPASFIFGCGVFLPRHYLVVFLQSYYSSRSLMRELLVPYFARIRFSPAQKKQFFKDREGVLFGFGVGFYIFLKIPLLGVLIYGIAEASTAYLITKITDPPPYPVDERFAESQVRWHNKHEFLHLPLSRLDAHNVVDGDETAAKATGSSASAVEDRPTLRKQYS